MIPSGVIFCFKCGGPQINQAGKIDGACYHRKEFGKSNTNWDGDPGRKDIGRQTVRSSQSLSAAN